jgi:hypothetical protein
MSETTDTDRVRRTPPGRTGPQRGWTGLYRSPTLRGADDSVAGNTGSQVHDGSFRLGSVEAMSLHAVRTAYRVLDENIARARSTVGHIYDLNRDSGGSVRGSILGAGRLARDMASLYAVSLAAPLPLGRFLFNTWNGQAQWMGAAPPPQYHHEPAPQAPPAAPQAPAETYRFHLRTGDRSAATPEWHGTPPAARSLGSLQPAFRESTVKAEILDDSRSILMSCMGAEPGDYAWIGVDAEGRKIAMLLWHIEPS